MRRHLPDQSLGRMLVQLRDLEFVFRLLSRWRWSTAHRTNSNRRQARDKDQLKPIFGQDRNSPRCFPLDITELAHQRPRNSWKDRYHTVLMKVAQTRSMTPRNSIAPRKPWPTADAPRAK